MNSDSKLIFTFREDERLLEMVAKCPHIYDPSVPKYKNQVAKDNTWKEIAVYVEKSVEDCKKRWKNIKDTYHRKLKRGQISGDTTLSKSKQWVLLEMLSFLDLGYKSNTDNDDASSQNYSDADNTELQAIHISSSSSEDEFTISKPSPIITSNLLRPNKRIKLNDAVTLSVSDAKKESSNKIKDSTQSNDDDVDLFFKSVAMSVKKLKPELINEAKLKSLHLLIDLEARNITPPVESTEDSKNTTIGCQEAE